MGPFQKKWNGPVERDLCLAIIMSTQDTNKPSYKWDKVLEIMHRIGHPFTKDAVTQRYSKVILADFRKRYDGNAGEGSSTPALTTPHRCTLAKGSVKGSAKGSAKGSSKRSRTVKDESEEDDVESPCAKKAKVEAALDSTTEVAAEDMTFDKWLAGDQAQD